MGKPSLVHPSLFFILFSFIIPCFFLLGGYIISIVFLGGCMITHPHNIFFVMK